MASTLLWRSLVLIAGFAGASWTIPAVAEAETISLDQGYVAIEDEQGVFRFAIGNAHFSAMTLPPLRSFFGSGFDVGCAALVCQPGQHLEMNNRSDGSVGLGLGTVYYHGAAYNPVDFNGRWQFVSRGADAPRDGSPTWSPSVPFTFSGTFSATMQGFSGTRDVFAIDVTGRGLAHADLLLGDFGYELAPGGTFTYKFNASSVTPEPASLVLVATAAALAWRRVSR